MGHWGRPYTNDQGVTQLDHYPTPTWCQDPERYIRDHNTPPDMTVTLHQPTGKTAHEARDEWVERRLRAIASTFSLPDPHGLHNLRGADMREMKCWMDYLKEFAPDILGRIVGDLAGANQGGGSDTT